LVGNEPWPNLADTAGRIDLEAEAASLRSLRFREQLSEVLVLYFKNKGLELWRILWRWEREGTKGNLSAVDRTERVSFDVRRTKSVKGKNNNVWKY
jgi:hypothetical protein